MCEELIGSTVGHSAQTPLPHHFLADPLSHHFLVPFRLPPKKNDIIYRQPLNARSQVTNCIMSGESFISNSVDDSRLFKKSRDFTKMVAMSLTMSI